MLTYVIICCHMLTYVKDICEHMLTYVVICCHMLTYLNIFQSKVFHCINKTNKSHKTFFSNMVCFS